MKFDTVETDLEIGAFNASAVNVEVQFRTPHELGDDHTGYVVDELEVVSVPFGFKTLSRCDLQDAIGAKEVEALEYRLGEEIETRLKAGDYAMAAE